MSTPTHDLKITTAEDLLNAPPDLGPCELVRGELVRMSPGKPRHGAVGAQLSALLTIHVNKNKLGMVFDSSTGYVVSRTPDTVREPDISFVSKSRLRDRDLDAFFEGTPDLAVEVLSPSNTVAEMQEKIADYFSGGGQVVWIVDPLRKSVIVYRPEAAPVVLSEADTLTEESLMPGFSIQVRDIFPAM